MKPSLHTKRPGAERPAFFLPAALALCLLTGCAYYQALPLSPEKTAAQLEARRLDDPGLKQFFTENARPAPATWPLQQWDLNSLTIAAFYFHPTLEVAREQWLLARAGVQTAAARPNPSVTVTPGYDSQIPGNYSPWLVPVTFDVPLETAGKRGKRIAEAEKNSESARWNFVSAAWSIRSGVRASLLDYSVSNRRAALLAEQFAAQQQIVRLLQSSFDAGEITRPELLTAQMALNKTQLDLSDARAKAADAHSRLAGALGLSEAALDGITLAPENWLHEAQPLTAASARRVALCSRADILAALADYATAGADLRLQVAKQYPDLHLGPGYAWNNGNAGDNQWSLGVTLELPILDQNQGPIAEAVARRKLAAAKFIELQSQVIGQIDRAVAGYRVALNQMQTAGDQLAAGRQQQKSVAAQVQAGAATRLDSAAAEIDLTGVELAELDSESQLWSALGVLEDALQSPADDIAAVITHISTDPPQGKASYP